MGAEQIARELRGLEWLGVPFAGGMSELPYIECRSIVVNDLHKHVINLAYCLAIPAIRRDLFWRLAKLPFAPAVLEEAQAFCSTNEPKKLGDFEAAMWYFVTQWMGRSGLAGTDREFKGGLSIRWTSTGGDSNRRYRSAVESIRGFGGVVERCNFSTLDCFEFLDNCRDEPGHGLYCDPPWPDDGDKYVHKFTPITQARLATRLAMFEKLRIVVRFGDHPLIRELYPETLWRWSLATSRTQGNKAKAEVLLVRRRGLATEQPLFT